MSVVLMYHDIVTPSDRSSGFQNESAFQYKVEETVFEGQVKSLQGKDVIFTFDDGGVSFFTKVAPILEKYDFRGVFFISTKYINTPGFLNESQVRALAASGHIIGSHSHSHPEIFTQLSRVEVHDEWHKSFVVLKDILGEKDFPVSIPNGYASKMIVKEAISCGYTDIYTSQPTVRVREVQGHHIIGRYVVHNNMTIQDVQNIVSSTLIRMKMFIKWQVLSIVKFLLGSSYEIVKAKVLHH